MVKISQIITYKGSIASKMRGFEEMMTKALTDAMVLWHRNDLPHHFGTPTEVDARYPGIYKPRGKGYMIAKARVKGHQQMLMWSGRSAANVMSQITVTGSSKEVRGRMKGANRNFNFSGVTKRGHVKPMMHVELNYVNDEEWRAIVELLEKRLQEFMDKDTPVEVGWIG